MCVDCVWFSCLLCFSRGRSVLFQSRFGSFDYRHFPPVFWRLLRDPFQGHPVNTFAVLLATLVVDKQCLVARARRRGAERSKRIDGKGRGRDAHRNSARNKTRSATEKGTFRKQREKRNETEGWTDRRNHNKTAKKWIHRNSRTNTRDIAFLSPQRSRRHQSQQWPLPSLQQSS